MRDITHDESNISNRCKHDDVGDECANVHQQDNRNGWTGEPTGGQVNQHQAKALEA